MATELFFTQVRSLRALTHKAKKVDVRLQLLESALGQPVVKRKTL
jgi:hypothetical protein